MEINLKQVYFGGVTLQIPEVWTAETEMYDEPDGRQCACIDVTAEEGDVRSIMISYGPMPEGSDAYIEASDTFEELIGETGGEPEDEPICEYDFLGTVGFGFEVPTEDALACNFICAEIGTESEGKNYLFTILTSAKSYEDIDDLLDLVEQTISFSKY